MPRNCRPPKPVPPEHKALYDLLWEVMRFAPKVNRNGARAIYPQALRSGAKRLYDEGWRAVPPTLGELITSNDFTAMPRG